MTTYNSISDIQSDFQIDSDNLDLIRERLNEIRIKCHPDKTNGQFPNDVIKNEYHNANNAIEYLNQISNNHSLTVVEKMTDLMKVITDLMPVNRQNSLQQNLDSKISFAITNFRSRMFLPKISLTVITAVVTFLFFFPGYVKDNPTLSHIIDPTSSFFVVIWFSLLLYSGLFWIMTFSHEEKAKKKLAFLKVDSIQNRLFDDFLKQNLVDKKFSKDDLTQFIYEQRFRSRIGDVPGSDGVTLFIPSLFGSDIITMEIAQNISEIIIARGERNKVVEKLNSVTLNDTYTLKI